MAHQAQLAELYDTSVADIAQIIRRVLEDGEVTEATINSELKVQTDFAEDRAQRRQATLMAEWVTQTDRFLDFNERTLLSGPGSVSAARMKQVAAERYAEFDQHRRALEAERAAAEELDDLRALTEIEKRRPGSEGDEAGHQPR